jgi:cell division protein FtsI (penicillin-binding protein 3)
VNVNGVGKVAKVAAKTISDSTMPDISGLKLQDALWLCEKKGLQVKCIGKGRVVKQSIAQGSYITKGQPILIELN